MKYTMVPMGTITWDTKYWARNKEDHFAVHRFTDALRSDPELQLCGQNDEDPPVGSKLPRKLRAGSFRYQLIDGITRFLAYERAQRTDFPLGVRDTGQIPTITPTRWLLTSTKINIQHGDRLSVQEITQAAVQIQRQLGWSVAQVAHEPGMTTPALVKMIGNRMVRVTGGSGGGKLILQGNGTYNGVLKAPFTGIRTQRNKQRAHKAQARLAAQSDKILLENFETALTMGAFDSMRNDLRRIRREIDKVLRSTDPPRS